MVVKKQIFLPIILIVMALLTACGAIQAAISAQTEATDEPEGITIYTVLASEVHEKYLPAFQKAHPDIKINVVGDLTGTITDRLIAEKDDPQADVVYMLAATSLLRAAAEGILEPYAPAGLERVNMRMRDANDPPLFVGTDVYMSAICVNPDELQAKNLPMPTSWQDLTNPVYKDYIIMPDPSISAIGYIAVSAFLQLWGEERGWAYMDALHENIALYTKSGSGPCRLAAQGKIPIGVSFGAEATTQKAAGMPVIAVFPAEGSGWEVEAGALVRKNVIKPEAKVFLDWAISDGAMQEYAHFFPVTSVPTNIPAPAGYAPEPIKQLIANRFLWVTANRDRVTAKWIERYGEKSEGQGAEIPDAFK